MLLIFSIILFHPSFSSFAPICVCALVWLSAHVWFQVPRGSSLSLPNVSERTVQSQKDPGFPRGFTVTILFLTHASCRPCCPGSAVPGRRLLCCLGAAVAPWGDPVASGCQARQSSFSQDAANFPSPLVGSPHFC